MDGIDAGLLLVGAALVLGTSIWCHEQTRQLAVQRTNLQWLIAFEIVNYERKHDIRVHY